MRCPSCTSEFHPQPDRIKNYWADDDLDSHIAFRFLIQQCPSCYEAIIIREKGTGIDALNDIHVNNIVEAVIVYPLEDKDKLALPAEVPESFSADFYEASTALEYSTKASAALSRRLLQKVFREQLDIKKKDLSVEIDEFIEHSKAPTYLTSALDAVRQIGNFAAHPMKFKNTGEIVDVEPGEAEWLLEVLESLFDFIFVQPAKLKLRRDTLNEKLKALGKPPLKGE